MDRLLPINTTRKSRKWLLFSAYYWQQTKTKHTPTHDLSKAKHQHFTLPIKRTEIGHRALALKTKTPVEIEQRNKEEYTQRSQIMICLHSTKIRIDPTELLNVTFSRIYNWKQSLSEKYLLQIY